MAAGLQCFLDAVAVGTSAEDKQERAAARALLALTFGVEIDILERAMMTTGLLDYSKAAAPRFDGVGGDLSRVVHGSFSDVLSGAPASLC